MSGIMDHLLGRRSIRKFKEQRPGEEQINFLLRAGMAAPSASNRKPWEFVVVTDELVLRRLRRRLPFGQYRAPMAIVVCGNLLRGLPPPAQAFWIQDCSAATQNILLAANGLGLGAVWIGIHPIGLLRWGVSRVLDLPRYVRPLGLVHIGYPAETKPARTQYDPQRVHWQRFGRSAPGRPEDCISRQEPSRGPPADEC